MKKILSLLSMLMVTVTAFATSYTDKLTYKLTVLQTVTKELPAGELTVDPYGQNYTVTAKGCDFSEFGDKNWYEIVCEGVPGTTDANGVTTIEVTNAYSMRSLDWQQFTATKLIVKFNGTKAYAHFEGQIALHGVNRPFEYTFGTNDFGSTGGGTVTEEYAVNFDKGAKSTHDRYLRSFSLQQTGKEKQTESVSVSRAAYEDHTSKVFTVEAGSQVTASFNYKGEWMHGYVYIDRDDDGEFSYTEGQWNQAGTDLVAYSFYTTLPNPKVNDGNGYNSTGASVSGDARSIVNPPSFTAPTEPGTYRIRFKIDWNCILPGGSSDILSDGGGVWDATLKVVAAEPEIEGTVVEGSKNYAANGSKFEWSNIAINWNKQKLVAVIDLSSCTGESENILSVGQNIDSWSIGGWHFYYTVASKKMKSDYLTTGDAHPISDDNTPVEPGIVRIELSKAEGCTINGVSFNGFYDSNVTGTWQSNTADFWALTSVNIGSKEGANRSNAVIKYVTVVDLPVTVKEEKTFNEVLYMNDQKVADATVVVKEMSDETINMSLKYGENEYTSTELTKGTDEKNRTTYTGKVSKDSQTYDVAGVVYEKDNAERLYMTMTATGETYVIGENPDAPKVVSTLRFENVAYTNSSNEQGTANVTFTEMSDRTFPMTFASSGGLNVNAKNLTMGEDANGRTTYTGEAKRTDVDVTFTVNAVVYGEAAAQKLYMTMDNGAGFVVTVGEDPDYVAPVTYKNTLKVVRGTDTKTYENAEVSVLAKGENKYAVTIPSFSDMEQNEGTIGKLTFEATGEEENGTLKLTATSAATTQEGGDGWENYDFTASMDATVTGETLAGTFTVVYPDDVTNYTYTLYYGVEPPVAPDTVDVVEEGFKATGESWKMEGVAIDWDTQYIAAKLDLSTCEISSKPENVLAVGTDITGWNDGPHYLFFYNKAEKILQYNYLHSANKSYNKNFANLSKAYIQLTDEVVTIEISKQGGLKINGESALVKYVDTASSPSTNSTESWTTEDLPTVFSGLWALNTIDFGGCQGEVMSNATYKYVKVVPLGWTEPVTPEVTEDSNETYTSNLRILDGETTVVEEAEANVNIVKYSDKSYKVTLKDVTLNENTQDLVFTGTLPTTEPGGQEPLAEEGEGEVTPAEPAMVLNATADEATATFLGATSATAEFTISYNAADEFMMTFTMKAGEKTYSGEFNYEAKTPAAEPFCKENYVADGNGFEWEIPVDWDTQKIVMSIDPSTCTGNCEDVIGLGAVPTAWVNTLHLYRTRDQKLQGYFQVPGGNNNNTDKFAETVPFLVEVSKAQGFVVNDEVKIAASEMSYLFTLPTVKMGTGEGANDKSRATYNYVKVVDKDWTKDPATGINATTVAEGEFEVFSVDGVKLAKLQKGLNIVRSADGKVKKVLVK